MTGRGRCCIRGSSLSHCAVKSGDLQSDARLLAIDLVLLEALGIVTRFACQALVLCIAAIAGCWNGLRLAGVSEVVVGRRGIVFERLTLQEVLANSVVVLEGEESTFVAPRALLDARCETPMPELPHWTQAPACFLGFWELLLENLNLDAFWNLCSICLAEIRDNRHLQAACFIILVRNAGTSQALGRGHGGHILHNTAK